MTSRAAVGVECMLHVMFKQARRFRCAVLRLTLICDAFFHHSEAALVKMGLTTEVYIQYTTFGFSPYVFPIAFQHCQKAMVASCIL
jgi:hypothetical protein